MTDYSPPAQGVTTPPTFRVEVACDGYSALTEGDVPEGISEPLDYIQGAHDAAEAIRAVLNG